MSDSAVVAGTVGATGGGGLGNQIAGGNGTVGNVGTAVGDLGSTLTTVPIADISYKKDSSLAMLLAAQARGWTLFYMEQQDLYLTEGKARARTMPTTSFLALAIWASCARPSATA